MKTWATVCALLCLMLAGCASREWKVTAYDLMGEKIYEGELHSDGSGYLKTKDGRAVDIINATVIMEEIK